MNVLDWRLAALALLFGLAIGGRGAWIWQANAYTAQLASQARTYSAEREAAAAAALDALGEQQDARRDLEDQLQKQEETHYKEMLDDQKARQRLRDQLATADVRLSVLIAAGAATGGNCGLSATPGPGCVVHGPARAELDPAAAQRIVGIAGDGDDGLKALQACQGYVRSVTGNDR